MKVGKFVIAAACYALLAALIHISLRADQNAPAETTGNNKVQEATPPPATAPAPGLLMRALGEAGLAGPLNKAGINIYGYVEGGYMYDFTAPRNHVAQPLSDITASKTRSSLTRSV